LILREHKAMCNFNKEESEQTAVQVTLALSVLAKTGNSLQNTLR